MEFDLGSQTTMIYIALLIVAATALLMLILLIIAAFTVISSRPLLRRIAEAVDRLERSVADAIRGAHRGPHS